MNVSRIVVSIFVLLLVGCHSSAPPMQRSAPVAAQVLTVTSSTASFGIVLSGVVHPRLEADIAAQVSGPVAILTKHEGDHVQRGEVLVRLHTPSLNASVTQAIAAVAAAEQQSTAAKVQATLAANTLVRYQKLRERHSVTPHEMEQMQAQSTAAQAQERVAAAQTTVAQEALAVQRANAADAVLIAPFDGVVTQRMADPGAMALPGVPLLHMQSTGETEVQFSMPDTMVKALSLEQKLSVTVGQDTQIATVTMLAPAGDAGSHTFRVKASLPKSNSWNTGTVVSIALPSLHADPRLVVPAHALVEQGGLTAAIVLDANNHAEVRYVSVGQTMGAQVQVLSGLKVGDRILAHGDLNLAGHSIEVRP